MTRAPRALGAAFDRYRLATSAPRSAWGSHSPLADGPSVATHDRPPLPGRLPPLPDAAGRQAGGGRDAPCPGGGRRTPRHGRRPARSCDGCGTPPGGPAAAADPGPDVRDAGPPPGRRDPGPRPRGPERTQAAPVRVPTLVTRGSREPIVPMAWATAAARLLPSAELAVVPGPHYASGVLPWWAGMAWASRRIVSAAGRSARSPGRGWRLVAGGRGMAPVNLGLAG
jgi:hypothetical protein